MDINEMQEKDIIESMLMAVDEYEQKRDSDADGMPDDDIFEAVSYIKKHFTEELTVNAMSKRLGYTPNYFSMKFKKLTGKNFIETVNDERLERAYSMLCAMDISISDVADYVGYSSVAYFSRMFKRKYKKSPRDVKKLKRKS